ncbi:hypothetical protein ODJ79_14470 [Actinoplanes sp. KI2]|uniref:hypothetical protein n=1 Tax=Actinoplanes sp. KI2 TaxID=2983315 RepID=UPI0021D57914|nr:hypothetical protein [Actinoplanes sp. KI2]MCU7724928.1 hypothetical protein [Actinoplanes sp. KI2]
MSRRTWIAAAAAAAIAAVGLTWLLWPEDAEPRARQYTAATACLLTPAAGLTDKDAVLAWDGMQKASLATHGKVRYLAVAGDQTPANAATYLATLAIGGCNLILAAGQAPAAAVDANAASYPAMHFVVVGAAKTQANVTKITEPDAAATTETVRTLVDKALKDAAG